MEYLLLASGYVDWFWGSWYELRQYATNLKQTHWMVISVASCVFGFFCLKGHSLKS